MKFDSEHSINKRGFIPLIPLTVGGILALTLFLAVLLVGLGGILVFAVKNAFVLGGLTLLILGTIFGFKMEPGRNKTRMLTVLFMIGGVLVLLPVFGFTPNQTFQGESYINIPLKGFYSCEPGTQATTTKLSSIAKDGSTVRCPAGTDQCTITIQSTESLNLIQSRTIIYSYNGAVKTETFRIINGIPSVTIPSVLAGKDVKVTYLGSFGQKIEGAVAYATYTPFILWKTSPSGGKVPYSTIEQGCDFKAKESAYLIISDTLGLGTGSSKSITGLKFYETRNFIDIVVPYTVEGPKIQNGGSAYCSNGNLYAIDDLQTTLNSYKVVNTNEVVGRVTCCNGDVEPGIRQCQNNQWVALPKPGTTPTGSDAIQCSLLKPCSGADNVPYTDKSLVRSVCENNVCVQKTTSVECTTNSACIDPKKPICDSKTYTCVEQAVLGGTGTPINPSDSIASCDVKAEQNPWLGYTWVVTTEEPGVFKEIFTLGLAKGKSSGECVAKFVPYYVFGFVIVLIAIISAIVFVITSPTKRKAR